MEGGEAPMEEAMGEVGGMVKNETSNDGKIGRNDSREVAGANDDGGDDDEEEEEEEEDDDDDDEGEDGTDDSSVMSWISWFTTLPGHEVFLPIPEEFIEDEFNLTGLSALVSVLSCLRPRRGSLHPCCHRRQRPKAHCH
jgi:hypothetical protein